MQGEFANRLDSFDRSLAVLGFPQHKPLWDDQPPLAAATKIGEARTMGRRRGPGESHPGSHAESVGWLGVVP